MQKTKVDWDEIKHRVNSMEESLSRNTSILPEEKRAQLKARAQALSIETKDESTQKEFVEIVVFSLASETYGIESVFIREVYPLTDITPLPGLPAFVVGMMNVRGQIVSVIDLKKFFNLPEKGLGELNKVIILHNDRMEFGILADIIQDTRSIAIEAIIPKPITTNGVGPGYLKGVTHDHIIILDGEKILGDKSIVIHQDSI